MRMIVPDRPDPAILTRALAFVMVLAAPGLAMAETTPDPVHMREEIVACLDAAAAAGGDPDGQGARACVGVQSDACSDDPDNQTTFGMMSCAMAERDAWDALLNAWWKPLRANALALDENSVDTGEGGAARRPAGLARLARQGVSLRIRAGRRRQHPPALRRQLSPQPDRRARAALPRTAGGESLNAAGGLRFRHVHALSSPDRGLRSLFH